MNELECRVRERLKQNTFMHYNHIEMESVNLNGSVFKLEVHPESRNNYGMVHGGAIYTLADNAAGSAAHADGRNYVTQTSSFHFLRNQGAGTIRAVASVRHRGQSTCLIAVDILGEGEKLLATGEFTFFTVDKALMEQKRPKE